MQALLHRLPAVPDPRATAGLAVAVTALGAFGVLPRWPGLVHVVALPPLDVMTDIRILLARAPEYPAFFTGLALSLAIRISVLALMLGPPDKRRFALAARFYLTVLPFAFVTAALIHASSAILFYALFWFGMIAAVVTLCPFVSIPWTAPRLLESFRLAPRRFLRAGTVGAYLAAVTGLGALADHLGPGATVALVPVSAIATWCAARALYADPGWRILRRALAAAVAAGLAALVFVAGTGPASPERPDVAYSRPGSVMLMSGIDSRSGSGAILEIDPNSLGYTCAQTYYYSYAGPGDGQPRNDAFCRIATGAPYRPEDTLRSARELVPFLERQVGDVPRPAVIASHSQGVWISWEAAARGRTPGAEALVLVGPFPRNPIPYPAGAPLGRHVGRDLVELASSLPRPIGTTVFKADSPLSSEWLADPDAIDRTLSRSLPAGIRAVSVPSVFDLPLISRGTEIEDSVTACPVPVVHPNLPYSGELHNEVRRFLAGEPPRACPAWRSAVGTLFRPFAAPPHWM